MEIEINQFDTMTQDEIIAEALRRGYTVRDVPNGGKRIGDSGMTAGPDEWMNAANVRLWQIQKS